MVRKLLRDQANRAKPRWQIWRDRRGRLSWLRLAALSSLFFPLVNAAADGAAILHGARPINELIHRAGFWSLVFLGVTLAVTPFRYIGRYGQLVDVRRMLGVGAFTYIAVHLALYAADQSFDLIKVVYEITHRVFLIIGIVAWLGLALLAATSTDAMIRRLGGLRWRRLHQAVYAIALLSLIHYFQQTKADVTIPVFAASLFFWLIAYRVLAWWQGTTDLSTWSILGLSVAVSLLTFTGEAIGVGTAFHVSPFLVLATIFDFDAGIRPGWQILAAGLAVVAVDALRSRWSSRVSRRQARAVAAE